MKNITIQPVPNQKFTVNIGDYRYDIALRYIEPGVMSYDFSIDKIFDIQGQRIIVGQFFMPYQYQEKDGNFYLYVPPGQTPDYGQFGQSQLLYYLNADEVDGVRNGN
jgi:hypothetical protein